MTSTAITPVDTHTPAATPSRVRWCASVVGATAVLYALTLLLPYVANGLHRVPLADVAGGLHDPKDLWPQGFLAGPMGLGAYVAMAAAPFVSVAGGAWSAWCAVTALRDGRRRLARAAAATCVLCVALAALALSPLGAALVSWQLD